MARLCPVCQSPDTGGYPKRHKQYTADRGRLDIDDWYCHACKSRWEIWEYPREGATEIKDVRLANGNRQAWGDLPMRTCPNCKGDLVTYVQHDGPWRGWGDETLRFECQTCGEIWQEMVRVEDGRRLARRLWRKGRTL